MFFEISRKSLTYVMVIESAFQKNNRQIKILNIQ